MVELFYFSFIFASLFSFSFQPRYSQLISKTWYGFCFLFKKNATENESYPSIHPSIQRSRFKKYNSNCAFHQWMEWCIRATWMCVSVCTLVYECEFDCMFSIHIYYVLIFSAWMMEFVFHFFSLSQCVYVCIIADSPSSAITLIQ